MSSSFEYSSFTPLIVLSTIVRPFYVYFEPAPLMSGRALEDLSVRELKEYLAEREINFTGYLEKSDLVRLARGELAPSNVTTDAFLHQQFGAASALAAEFELEVRSWSVKQLRDQLRRIGIDYSKAIEKDELVALVLDGANRAVHVLKAEFSEPSDNVLEC